MSPERTVISEVLIQLAEKDSDESFSRWIHNISDLESQPCSCRAGLSKKLHREGKKKKFSLPIQHLSKCHHLRWRLRWENGTGECASIFGVSHSSALMGKLLLWFWTRDWGWLLNLMRRWRETHPGRPAMDTGCLFLQIWCQGDGPTLSAGHKLCYSVSLML